MSRPFWYAERLCDVRRDEDTKPDAVAERMTQLAREGWEDLEPETYEDVVGDYVVISGIRETCGHCLNGAELGKRDERIRELRAEVKRLKAQFKGES